jgi:hypothetical protein
LISFEVGLLLEEQERRVRPNCSLELCLHNEVALNSPAASNVSAMNYDPQLTTTGTTTECTIFSGQLTPPLAAPVSLWKQTTTRHDEVEEAVCIPYFDCTMDS